MKVHEGFDLHKKFVDPGGLGCRRHAECATDQGGVVSTSNTFPNAPQKKSMRSKGGHSSLLANSQPRDMRLWS